MIPSENIKVGDTIIFTKGVVTKVPSPMGNTMEMEDSQLVGYPLKVKAISLPFIAVEVIGGSYSGFTIPINTVEMSKNMIYAAKEYADQFLQAQKRVQQTSLPGILSAIMRPPSHQN